MHKSLKNALGLSFPSILAVVGCGGKTSFIELAARSYPSMKVLISPTTKMFPLNAGNAHCRGIFNENSGKLEALPADELAGLTAQYDLSLLEADGSRSLLCKGWREDEPVVPEYCTHTIGIVTMSLLGEAATDGAVHNLPLFLSLTGLRESQLITMQALMSMVCAPGGMFKNSAGSRVLLVNQVEDDSTCNQAYRFLEEIIKSYPGFFDKLLFGSVHRDTFEEVRNDIQ